MDEEADVVVRPVGVRVTRRPVALLHDPTTLLEPWRVVEVVGELGWLRVTLPEASGQERRPAGDTPRSLSEGGGR